MLGRQKPQQEGADGTWRPANERDCDMADKMTSFTLQEMARVACSGNALSVVAVDDEVAHLRAAALRALGFPLTRIIGRKMGVCSHGVVHSGLQLWLGSVVDKQGVTLHDHFGTTIMAALQRVPHPDMLHGESMAGFVFAIDRGYFSVPVAEYVGTKGGHTLGTVKRGRGLPVTYGPKVLQKGQDLFSEAGTKFAQGYSKQLPCGKTLKLLMYRNGLGKAVILETTYPGFGVDQWVFELDTTYGRQDQAVPLIQTELGMQYSNILCGESFMLTTGQRDASWFLARIFKFTSSVAFKAINHLAKMVNLGNICLEDELFDEAGVHALSFVLKLFGQSDSGKQLLKDRQLTADDIKRLKMPQLKSLARRAGIPLGSKKKEELQKKVLEWFSIQDNVQTINGKNTMAIFMSQLPFLKPFRSPDLSAGTLNEPKVLKWAAWYLEKHCPELRVVHGPCEVGLIVVTEQQYLATSPDGLCKIAGGDLEPRQCVIEIKSKVNQNTVEQTTQELIRRRGLKPMELVGLNLTNYEEVRLHYFPDLTHFAQCLHHCCITGTPLVLYLVADTGAKGILMGVLMMVPRELQDQYKTALSSMALKYWAFCFGNNGGAQQQWPSFEGEEGAWGYAGNVDVAKQQFALLLKLTEIVIQRGCPLPLLLRIIPLLVWLWNKLKCGIDVSTKYTNFIFPEHRKLNASQTISLRDMCVRVRN
ncbi:unnamed protein product, partial [Heterosigma akashiwo]